MPVAADGVTDAVIVTVCPSSALAGDAVSVVVLAEAAAKRDVKEDAIKQTAIDLTIFCQSKQFRGAQRLFRGRFGAVAASALRSRLSGSNRRQSKAIMTEISGGKSA